MIYTLAGRHVVVAAKRVNNVESRLRENLLPTVLDSVSDFSSLAYVSNVSFNIPSGAEVLTLPPYPAPVVYAPIEVPPIDVRIAAIWNDSIHELLTLFDFQTYPQLIDICVYVIPTSSVYFFPLAIPRSASLSFPEGGEPLRADVTFTSSYVAIYEVASAPQPPADASPAVVSMLRTILSIDGGEELMHPRRVVSMNMNINNQLNQFHPMPVVGWGEDVTQLRTPRFFALGYTTVEANFRTYQQPTVAASELNGKVLSCQVLGYDKDMNDVLLNFSLKGVVTSSRTSVDVNQAVMWDISVSAFGDATSPPLVWG